MSDRLTIRLGAELLQRLETAAKAAGRSKSALARAAIAEKVSPPDLRPFKVLLDLAEPLGDGSLSRRRKEVFRRCLQEKHGAHS
jgi:predicted DNA-binding protein